MRKLEVTLEQNTGLQSITSISYVFKEVFDINFVFDIKDKSKVSLRDYLDINSPKIEYITMQDLTIIYGIFDSIVIRYLFQKLPSKEYQYLTAIKGIINLPFYAVNKQFVFFSSFLEKSLENPFLRVQFDDSNNLIGLTIFHFNQNITEQILSFKSSYLHNLTISLNNVANSKTLYQKFSNFKRIDHLFLAILFSVDQEWWPYHIFEYSAIEHLQVQSLGLWMGSTRPDGNVDIINYPKEVNLSLLIVSKVNLPQINGWNVDTLILNRHQSLNPTNYDYLPDKLQLLKIKYNSIIDEKKFIISKIRSSVKKIVFLQLTIKYRETKENILSDENISQNFLKFFPNAEIETELDNVLSTYRPLNRVHNSGDWYFRQSEEIIT
jgi:hypothetical protein